MSAVHTHCPISSSASEPTASGSTPAARSHFTGSRPLPERGVGPQLLHRHLQRPPRCLRVLHLQEFMFPESEKNSWPPASPLFRQRPARRRPARRWRSAAMAGRDSCSVSKPRPRPRPVVIYRSLETGAHRSRSLETGAHRSRLDAFLNARVAVPRESLVSVIPRPMTPGERPMTPQSRDRQPAVSRVSVFGE